MKSSPQGKAQEVFFTFLQLGFICFGGPIAHLGYFHHELVQKRGWMSEKTYAHLVSLCQFLPGPASSQVGFAAGMVRAGFWGGVAAWVGFTLPSALLLILFASLVHQFTGPLAEGLLQGLKLTALVMVAHAVWSMHQQLAPDKSRTSLALVALASALIWPGIFGQMLALLLGAVIGFGFFKPKTSIPQSEPLPSPVGAKAAMLCLTIAMLLFAVLPALAWITEQPLIKLIDIFYRAGGLVFGGGHVVLPLLEAEMVHGALVRNEDFLAGYGAAQAIPGPLFTFAAYLGTLIAPAPNIGLAFVALGAIFLPGLLLLVGIWPFWTHLRTIQAAQGLFVGLNASVVGILGAALYDPLFISAIVAPHHLVLALFALLLLMKWHVPPWIILALLVSMCTGMTLI